MARQITVDLISDTRAFERSMGSADKAVDKLDSSLKTADTSATKFDHAIGKTGESLEGSAGKFRAVNDIAGGLGATLGIAGLDQVSMYATGIADLSDGMGQLLAPALAKAKGAFLAMNSTLAANPIFLVVAVLAALAIAFVVAYKKSETFRNIVNGAMSAVTDGVKAFGRVVENVTVGAAKKLATIADIITTPYQLAFKAIAHAWNATVGKLHVSIPGFLGFGGVSFDVPDIPELAKGGPAAGGRPYLVGERGPELFVPNMSGTVVPNSSLGGGGVTVVINTGASDLDELIRKRVRVLGNGNVQTAYGR